MSFDELLSTRSAAVYADFFLPYLNRDMHVLDVGCGDGAISVGLSAVAGRVTAIDASREEFALASAYLTSEGGNQLVFLEGDGQRLEFADASFDAGFCHSTLEAVPDPAAVLSEVWRVLRPGGRVGVASVEYGGLILAGAGVDLLWASNAVREQVWLRSGSDPFLGRELRRLLVDAGFDEVEGTTKAFSYGTPELVRQFARGRAEECCDKEYVAEVVSAGLSTAKDLTQMAECWTAWGESPASYAAFTWCRAVGRKPLESSAR